MRKYWKRKIIAQIKKIDTIFGCKLIRDEIWHIILRKSYSATNTSPTSQLTVNLIFLTILPNIEYSALKSTEYPIFMFLQNDAIEHNFSEKINFAKIPNFIFRRIRIILQDCSNYLFPIFRFHQINLANIHSSI